MTEDEDTADDNDRMERANRIREMREGRRRNRSSDGDDDDAAGDDSDDATSDTSADESAEPDAGSEQPTDGEDEAVDTTDEGEESPGEESGTKDGERDTDPAPERAEPDVATTDDEGATESDESPESDAASSDETVDGVDERSVEESGFEFQEDTETMDDEHSDKVETDEPAAEGVDDERSDVDRPDTQSGVAQRVSAGDAADAVADLAEQDGFAIPDQATTVTEDDDQTMLEGAEGVTAGTDAAGETTHTHDRTRVLEFELGGERFCLDIEYIEEIVELENITRVPNSPSFVEGVVDLRGQVTSIINPKDALNVDEDGQGELIIVFDSEEMDEGGHLGWVVDDVRQVTPVADEDVNESPDEEEEHINGIINREDEDDFIVWTTPELALHS